MANGFKSNLENDGIVIVMWFFKHQYQDRITLAMVERDTGIPSQTLHWMLWGNKKICSIVTSTAGCNDWPLSHIAYRYGYCIKWLGPYKGYISVRRANVDDTFPDD